MAGMSPAPAPGRAGDRDKPGASASDGPRGRAGASTGPLRVGAPAGAPEPSPLPRFVPVSVQGATPT